MAMKITQLENGVMEYDTGKAIVRIHPGKLTQEDIRGIYESALQKKATQDSLEKAGLLVCVPGGNIRVHSDGGYSLSG